MLIESEQLKKAVRENYGGVLDAVLVCQFIDEYAEPVDAEPVKHAHWRGWTTSAFMGMDDLNEPIWRDQRFYRCSRCDNGTVIMSSYCSHCGAVMDEEAEI